MSDMSHRTHLRILTRTDCDVIRALLESPTLAAAAQRLGKGPSQVSADYRRLIIPMVNAHAMGPYDTHRSVLFHRKKEAHAYIQAHGITPRDVVAWYRGIDADLRQASSHARNVCITQAYLAGDKDSDIAFRYGLSRERIPQIVHITLRRYDNNVMQSIQNTYGRAKKADILRYKTHFLRLMQDYDGSSQDRSPVCRQ